MKEPKALSWADCIRLSKSGGDLHEYLVARLVSLTTEDGSTAIRAVEALMGLAVEDSATDFNEVSTERLYELRERARQFIHSEGSRGDDERSAGEA